MRHSIQKQKRYSRTTQFRLQLRIKDGPSSQPRSQNNFFNGSHVIGIQNDRQSFRQSDRRVHSLFYSKESTLYQSHKQLDYYNI